MSRFFSHTSFKGLAAVICMLCVFFGSTVSAIGEGVILCVCPSGHMQFELDCSETPCPDDGSDSGESDQCVEIPLAIAGAQLPDTAVVTAPEVTKIASTFLLAQSFTWQADSPRESLPPPPDARASAPVLYRTSVLLI